MQWHFLVANFFPMRVDYFIISFLFVIFSQMRAHILFYAFLNDDFFAIRSDCRRAVRPPCHSLRLSTSPHPLSPLARIRGGIRYDVTSLDLSLAEATS